MRPPSGPCEMVAIETITIAALVAFENYGSTTNILPVKKSFILQCKFNGIVKLFIRQSIDST